MGYVLSDINCSEQSSDLVIRRAAEWADEQNHGVLVQVLCGSKNVKAEKS